jgi:hypothetical protein
MNFIYLHKIEHYVALFDTYSANKRKKGNAEDYAG